MIAGAWCYAVQVLRNDLTPVRQVPVTLDWDPLQESVRFVALQRGIAASQALSLDCTATPIWSAERGEPYVGGIRVSARATGAAELSVDFCTNAFSSLASAAATALVTEGVLTDGEVYRFLPMAFSQSNAADAPLLLGRLRTRQLAPVLPIASGSLVSFTARATRVESGGEEPGDDCPVFIPESILAEARMLARATEARETGGLLVGHLHRDTGGSGLFLQVTAQLPARHVDASSTKLTFTSDTWTDFRAALALRRRDETMLGWWHSHPVREWCKACPEEKQRACSLRGDFLSGDDRLLHRAVFPGAWNLALVVNDVGYDDPTVSLFGWRRGVLALRGHHILGAAPAASTHPNIQEALRAGV